MEKCCMNNMFEFDENINCYKVYFQNGDYFLIDEDDFEKVSKHNWFKGKRGYPIFHTSRKDRYGTKTVTLHRLIMNTDKKQDIDHISGNKLDNRKRNLRSCSHQENMFNQRKRKSNTSGFIGVSKHKCGKYEAYANKSGKKYYLGLYETAECAARARDNFAKKIYGEYASLNFSTEGETL